MSGNDLGYEEVGQALGDMLATNSTLQQLNLSNNFVRFGSARAENKDRPAKFVRALSVGLRDNRALTALNLADNSIGGCYAAAYKGQALSNQTFTATPEGRCV
jgi:hypothetical protein